MRFPYRSWNIFGWDLQSRAICNHLLCKIVIGNESTFENPRKKRRPEAAMTIRSSVSIDGLPVSIKVADRSRRKALMPRAPPGRLGPINRSSRLMIEPSISAKADTSFTKPSINPLTAIGIKYAIGDRYRSSIVKYWFILIHRLLKRL